MNNNGLYTELIYTKDGIATENPLPELDVLHFGSGTKKLPGSISVDILDLPQVDVVHDLDVFPWPFEDNSFDLVYGHNSLEHLDNIVAVMNEMHRILRPNGRVVLTVPYFRSTDAFGDPTHKHFFTSQSMDSFTEARYQYTDSRFKEIGFWYGWPQPSKNPLMQMFKNYIHRHPKFYDSHLSLLFPAKIVIWELETIA